LEVVDLIENVPHNGYRRKQEQITTTSDIPSGALRKSHRKTLEHCIAAINDIEVELRDISAMTVVMDPSRMLEAKQMLKEFRRRFSTIMESGAKKEVYSLSIQLIPQTKGVNSK